MKYYYLNTDGDTWEKWVVNKMAFAGDYQDAVGKHSRLFKKLEPGDVLFAYRSGMGYVGIGIVDEKWDEECHTGDQNFVNATENIEYRIKVQWFRLKPSPRTAKSLGLPTTPYYYCEIDPDKYEVKERAAELLKGNR